MSYISFDFFFFVAATLLVYYIAPLKARPYVLLAASLFFYAASGLENLAALVLLIAVTYLCTMLLEKLKKGRAALLTAYILLTVGGLLFVKFINYILGLSARFLNAPALTLEVLVPLGLSFFTLQAIGYAVDVYRGDVQAERNPLKLALFLSFFPLVVQGPISRMRQLSPTLFHGNRFSYKNLTHGAQLMLWGLFLKLVIANRAASFSDPVFTNYSAYSGLTVVLAVLLYTLQLYADFSGCVCICRGVSQMLGVELMDNFDTPYFAVSIRDFWRRWHISLSSWLRDYVYIPLGGSKKGRLRKYTNLLLTFFVSGIWHGVGVHYIAWGLYHGVLQIIGDVTVPMKKRLRERMRLREESILYRLFRQLITFVLVAYGWLLFRADGLIAAIRMTGSIFRDFVSLGQLQTVFANKAEFCLLLLCTLLLLLTSLLRRRIQLRERIAGLRIWIRWPLYLALFFAVVLFGGLGEAFSDSIFLYMQF